MHKATLLALLLATPSFAIEPAPENRVEIKVTEAGFEPREVRLRRGEPVTLVFLRTTDRTCITAIDIPAENVKKLELPLHRSVTLTFTPQKAGVESFQCSAMGMGGGKLVVK
ncbi:MAG TPA: cupredoxin domain-containing protein [Anaeromyxobacteraceae bacterium]|nr:cupredoxin domain-containing protein [Anaeromyxobacteraceae bacterium]